MKKQSSSFVFPHNFSHGLLPSRSFPLLPVVSFCLLISLVVNGIYHYQSLERTRVIAVPDGDSLQLADGRRVRLLGLDAPERGRCMAGEARDKLVALALGKRVRLENLVTDDYGRTLANVIVESIPTWFGYLRHRFISTDSLTPSDSADPLVQRTLLSAGLARNRSSSGNPYHQVLKDAQEIAKSGKLGIWSDTCRSQTPESGDCTIKGNTRAGEKYYYVPSCSQYSQVLIDRAYGDAWFCSEVEAKKAGFVKAQSCQR